MKANGAPTLHYRIHADRVQKLLAEIEENDTTQQQNGIRQIAIMENGESAESHP
jgi:hypothetical protein